MWSGSMSATGLIVSTVHVVWLIWTKGSGVRRFVRQMGTLALLSTSDRAITLPAKRWTPPVSGQLIVRLDVCMLLWWTQHLRQPTAGVSFIIAAGSRFITERVDNLPRKRALLSNVFQCGILFFLRAFALERWTCVFVPVLKFLLVCVSPNMVLIVFVVFRLMARMYRTGRKPWLHSPVTSAGTSYCWLPDLRCRWEIITHSTHTDLLCTEVK